MRDTKAGQGRLINADLGRCVLSFGNKRSHNMIFICALLALVACATGQAEVDFITLATVWPQSDCEVHKHDTCTIPASTNTFTLRGFWPDNFGGEYPVDCEGEEFDITQLQSLVPLLEQLWPNVLEDGTNEELWKEQWDRHGKCAVEAGLFTNQETYFSEALTQVVRYNAFQILASAGIGPSNEPQSLGAILRALDETFYYRFNVNCQYLSDPDRFVLSELQVCFNQTMSPIDCYIDGDHTSYHTHGCDVTGEVLYLPIQH